MSFLPARPRLASLEPALRQRHADAFLAAMQSGALPRWWRQGDVPAPSQWATYLHNMADFADGVARAAGLGRAPAWTGADPVPPEFMAVFSGEPLANADPRLPEPPGLRMPLLMRLSRDEGAKDKDGSALGALVHAYDLALARAVGGALADDRLAWAVPLYWCFAAWAGSLYRDLIDATYQPDPSVRFNAIRCVDVGGRVIVFVADAQTRLWATGQKAPRAEWAPWTEVTQHAYLSDPLICLDGEQRLHAFSYDSNAEVIRWTRQRGQDLDQWLDVVPLPGSKSFFAIHGMGACLNAGNFMDFFAIGSDGKIYNKAGDRKAFLHDWGYVGGAGIHNGSMTVTYMPQDKTVIVLHVCDSVWALTQQADGYCRDPYRIDPLTGVTRIWSARNSGEKLTVLALTGDGTLWCCFSNEADGHWEPFYAVTQYVSEACLVRGSDRRLALFTLDSRSGTVSQRWQLTPTARDWTPAQVIGGPGFFQLAAVPDADGRMQLFGLRRDADADSVWQFTQMNPGQGYMRERAQFY